MKLTIEVQGDGNIVVTGLSIRAARKGATEDHDNTFKATVDLLERAAIELLEQRTHTEERNP